MSYDYNPAAPFGAIGEDGQLHNVPTDYAEADAIFRRDFLDLDDGHATERLVDRVFMVDGL